VTRAQIVIARSLCAAYCAVLDPDRNGKALFLHPAKVVGEGENRFNK